MHRSTRYSVEHIQINSSKSYFIRKNRNVTPVITYEGLNGGSGLRSRLTVNVSASLSGDNSESNANAEVEATKGSEKKVMSSLAKRAIFGTILGTAGAVVIVLGGWTFAAAASLVAYQCSQEFIGLVNAKGISQGMKPPPPLVSSVVSLLCVGLCAWSYVSGGKMASAMAVASFLVLSLQLLVSERPKFSQLTSSVFGLMYCGYLPSFWVKLRLLSVPATNSVLLNSWEVCL